MKRTKFIGGTPEEKLLREILDELDRLSKIIGVVASTLTTTTTAAP